MSYIDDCKKNAHLFRVNENIENAARGSDYKRNSDANKRGSDYNKKKQMMKSVALDIINRGFSEVELMIKEIKNELRNAYKEMISSFDQSNNTLSGVRFSVEHNQELNTIMIPEGDTKTVNKSRKGMISYFTDFLKM